MKIRISTIAVICAATLAGAGTAAADPAPAVVRYRAASTDIGSVTVELTNGRFAVDPDDTAVTIRDDAGRVLDAVPLAYAIGDQRMPIHAQISGDATTLTLTPETAGLRRYALTPVASPLENQLAMNDLVDAVSIGTSVGALIGTAVGAVLGIGLGIVLAGASCAVLSVACVVAVLPIVSLAGAAGGVTGLVLGGGPATAVGLYRYISTLLAPPGTSEYAPDLRGRPGVPDTGH